MPGPASERDRKTGPELQGGRSGGAGVNATQPMFSPFLLSSPLPANCSESSSENCKLWRPPSWGWGDAQLERKAFECCTDHSTRRMPESTGPIHCLDRISAPDMEGTEGPLGFPFSAPPSNTSVNWYVRVDACSPGEGAQSTRDKLLKLAAHSGV